MFIQLQQMAQSSKQFAVFKMKNNLIIGLVLISIMLGGCSLLFGMNDSNLNGNSGGGSTTNVDDLIKSGDVIEATIVANPGHPGFMGAYDFSKAKAVKIYFSDYETEPLPLYDLNFYDGGFEQVTYQADLGEVEVSMADVECPEITEAFTYWKPMKLNHVYCIKTLEDDYVKILITDLYETDSGQEGAPDSWVDFHWIWT